MKYVKLFCIGFLYALLGIGALPFVLIRLVLENCSF
jgi:hypothetical protein